MSWCGWQSRWVPSAELERQAQQIVRGRLEKIAPAIVRPYRGVAQRGLLHFSAERSARQSARARPAGGARAGDRADFARRADSPFAHRERRHAAVQPLVLPQRSGRGWLECRAGVRHPRRGADLNPDSRVRQLAVTGIPPLRRVADARAGRACTRDSSPPGLARASCAAGRCAARPCD